MSTLGPQEELPPQVEQLERIQQRWKRLVEGAGTLRPTKSQPCLWRPLGKRLLTISFKRPLSLRSFSGSLLEMGVRRGDSGLCLKGGQRRCRAITEGSAQLRELYLSQLDRGSHQQPEHSAWPCFPPLFLHSLPGPPTPFHLHCFSPFECFSERGFSPRWARWRRNPDPPWAVAALCLCRAGWKRARGWCWQNKGYLSWPVNGPARRSQGFTPVQCRDRAHPFCEAGSAHIVSRMENAHHFLQLEDFHIYCLFAATRERRNGEKNQLPPLESLNMHTGASHFLPPAPPAIPATHRALARGNWSR